MKTILIHACRLAHVGERFKDTQNIAFLISGKNKSIFHSGDTDPFQTGKYTGVNISELKVDIGLINEDYAKIENANLTREFINAKHNIAMHLPDSVAIGWMDLLKDKPDLFSSPFIFTKIMEKKVYYTGHEKKEYSTIC
jgi:L-ascorbate metabolism protein UlaG (beta-lactamase superfamily)